MPVDDTATSARPIPVILNPGARGYRAGARVREIGALSGRVRVFSTAGPGDARRIARELALSGEPIVVAAGGDGTVNEVLNGVVDAGAADRTALGVLPVGTVNVFARELGAPPRSLAACWRAITRGRERTIDLWRVNDTSFAQLAGVGTDAEIIRSTSAERKKRLGAAGYVLSGLGVLMRPGREFTVTVPGRPPMSAAAVLVGNGRYYGGPFRLFPNASMRDRLLDVVVLRDHRIGSVFGLLRAIPSGVYRGAGAAYFQTESLTVESDEPVPYEVDGELAGAASTVRLERSGTIRVMGVWTPLHAAGLRPMAETAGVIPRGRLAMTSLSWGFHRLFEPPGV